MGNDGRETYGAPSVRSAPMLFVRGRPPGPGLLICTAWNRGPGLSADQLAEVQGIRARIARTPDLPAVAWVDTDGAISPIPNAKREWLRRKAADHPVLTVTPG